MDTVVMTGSSGFLGRYVAKTLAEAGYGVIALVRRRLRERAEERMASPFGPAAVEPGTHLPKGNITELICDFDNPLLVVPEIENNIEPTTGLTFLHFAWGGVSRIGTVNDALQEESRRMSMRCLNLAIHLGCKRFIMCGTCAEYGPVQGVCEETLECRPTTPYGQKKHEFYESALRICATDNIDFLNIRPFSVIGIGDHPWSLVATSCTAFAHNEPMTYHSPCTQLWNFMSVEDFARAVVLLTQREAPCPYDNKVVNIASGDTRPLRSFIEEIRTISGATATASFPDDMPASAPMVPSTQRLRELTGWSDTDTFGGAVQRIINDVRLRGGLL